MGSRGGCRWVLLLFLVSCALLLGLQGTGVDERFFGLLMVEKALVSTMLSMRASSLWNRLRVFTNSFENSRAP